MSLPSTTNRPLSVGSHAAHFHQRKPSLTSQCLPTGSRQTAVLSDSLFWKTTIKYCKYILRLRWVRVLGLLYVWVSVMLATVHLFSALKSPAAESLPQQSQPQGEDKNTHLRVNTPQQETTSSDPIPLSLTLKPVFPQVLPRSPDSSPINNVSTTLRLSKMFSKTNDEIRPYFLVSSTPPASDALTLATFLTLDEWHHLSQLSELWSGPISATLQIAPLKGGLGAGTTAQLLFRIRKAYENHPSMKHNVDIHLVIRPSMTDPNGSPIHGGIQEARNIARLFSRTEFVCHIPITIQWMTRIDRAVSKYHHLLRRGDVLVVPTFGFPAGRHVITDEWPLVKEEMVDWVDEGRIGMFDHHWQLNYGPTSFETWRNATEPYQVSEYDYHYNPTYIISRDGHPWCEERFVDLLPACLFKTYLAGANLWVLPKDYIVRTGREPENKLTVDERKIQATAYKNYRIEQCLFYARQYDQAGQFGTERSKHVQQECEKALRSLRKEKMISSHPNL